MNVFHSVPQSDVTAVITDQELADWLGVEDTDPLLSGIARAATAAAIEYLGFELISRERITTWETWPTIGTDTTPSISRNNEYLEREIELPYAKPSGLTVSELLIAGEAYADYRILDRPIAELYFSTIPAFSNDDFAAIKATYTAGYGATPDDIPQDIKTAVTMAADFLYNNRGSCSAGDSLHKSGASVLLDPFRARVIVL